MAQLNRNLAARYAIYAKDWPDALSTSNNSFFDLNGDFDKGAYFLYFIAGRDR